MNFDEAAGLALAAALAWQGSGLVAELAARIGEWLEEPPRNGT